VWGGGVPPFRLVIFHRPGMQHGTVDGSQPAAHREMEALRIDLTS
jgi:hypothetical protein